MNSNVPWVRIPPSPPTLGFQDATKTNCNAAKRKTALYSQKRLNSAVFSCFWHHLKCAIKPYKTPKNAEQMQSVSNKKAFSVMRVVLRKQAEERPYAVPHKSFLSTALFGRVFYFQNGVALFFWAVLSMKCHLLQKGGNAGGTDGKWRAPA